MKTRFTSITMFVLIFSTCALNAESKKSANRKPDFSKLKNASVTNNPNPGQFKNRFATENQLSVPGNSEDYSWDTNLNDWLHDTNTTYSYDGSGRVTEEIVQEAGTGIYVSRISYAYDFHGNTTEEVSYVRGNDEWIPTSGYKLDYTISAESQINGYIEQTVKDGAWVNESRVEYFMNAFNIPIGMLTYHWNGADWALFSKTVNITWADWQKRQLAAYTIMEWKNDTWVNSERYSSQIDGNNYTSTTEFWENVEWVNSTRETYSRTLFNEEIILENWTESGWKKTEKYLGTFDAYGNPTAIFYSTWDENKWVTDTELFFDLAFNQSNDVAEMIFRYRDPGLSAPVNIAKYKYSNFLHFGTTDVKDVNVLENVKAFPNPVNNRLNIMIGDINASEFSLSITNLAGQTIFTKKYSSPSITVNTEGFTKGIYLLNLKSSDGKIHNGKILKTKDNSILKAPSQKLCKQQLSV